MIATTFFQASTQVTDQDKADLFSFWDHKGNNLAAFLDAMEIVATNAQVAALKAEWEALQVAKSQEELIEDLEKQAEEIAPEPQAQPQAEPTAKGYTFTPIYEGITTKFFIYEANGRRRYIGAISHSTISQVWEVQSNARKTRKRFNSQADAIQFCIKLWERDCESLQKMQQLMTAA